MGVGHFFIFGQLLIVAAVGVGNGKIGVDVHSDRHRPAADGAKQAPGQQRLDRPGEVIMQAGDGDVGAGIGEVNGPQDAILDDRFSYNFV